MHAAASCRGAFGAAAVALHGQGPRTAWVAGRPATAAIASQETLHRCLGRSGASSVRHLEAECHCLVAAACPSGGGGGAAGRWAAASVPGVAASANRTARLEGLEGAFVAAAVAAVAAVAAGAASGDSGRQGARRRSRQEAAVLPVAEEPWRLQART